VPVRGRGNAGGIQLAATLAQAKEVAAAILRMTVRGLPVRKLLVEEAVEMVQKLYLPSSWIVVAAEP
jgi:succinyl-CoA synthetase beta subunit